MRSSSGLFENRGLGWVCIACAASSQSGEAAAAPGILSRGEAEGPDENTIYAMARWANKEKSEVGCPRCGRTDPVGERDGE